MDYVNHWCFFIRPDGGGYRALVRKYSEGIYQVSPCFRINQTEFPSKGEEVRARGLIRLRANKFELTCVQPKVWEFE